MPKLSPEWKKRLVSGAVLLTSGVLVLLLIYRPGWTGFGPDLTTNTERDGTGNVIKVVEVEQAGKTLWDWLSVLGVPLSLAVLGFWFQQQQQRRADEQAKLERERSEQQMKLEKGRADEQAKLEREIAESNQQEEVLQAYFDRLSALLVDKNLLAISAKLDNAFDNFDEVQAEALNEQKELLDSSIDVIRARTLAILRRLKDSKERKGSVIRFLVESDIISKLKLPLKEVNFSGADLSSADLSNVDLTRAVLINVDLNFSSLHSASAECANLNGISGVLANFSAANLYLADLCKAYLLEADFSQANLSLAKLVRANMESVNLNDADLTCANLSYVDFDSANLKNAIFNRAILSHANLSRVENWTEDQLNRAMLCNTQLPEGCDLDPNRDCEELQKRGQN